MITKNISINQLKVAKTNVRKGNLTGIDELAANIKELGLLQPLVVRKVGKLHHVVAGQRRLTAIQLLNKETEVIKEVPCQVLDGDSVDDETISLSENSFTQDMDYVQRCEVYAMLVKNGKSIHSIAQAFGTTDHNVNQFLAIGNLTSNFRALYFDGRISGDTLMFCTRFSDDEQAKIITAIESKEIGPSKHSIKEFMLNTKVKLEHALFDVVVSGLAISHDLFSEERFVIDVEAFWKLQYEAVELKKVELEGRGWEVKVVRHDAEFNYWNYSEGTKKEGATFVLRVDTDGELIERKLILKKSPVSTGDDSVAIPKSPRQEITAGAQKYYSDWHYQMVRNQLNNDPKDCFVWFVTNMLCGNGISFDCSNFAVNDEDTQLKNSVMTKSLDALFKKYNGKYSLAAKWRNSPIKIYKQLSKLKQAELINLCNAVLLATLADDTETIEFIGVTNKLNPLDHWKADSFTVDTFSSKDSTTAVASELIKDESQLAVFQGKTIKQRKVDLTANLKPDFVPKYMEFPVSKYGEVKLNIERFTK